MAQNERQGSFRSRFSKSPSKSTDVIQEDENDFPFAQATFVRIGSAHIVCNSQMDSDAAALLARICGELMKTYQPDAPAAKVYFDRKDTKSYDSKLIEYIPDDETSTDGSSHFFRDQQLLKLMYLCVQIRGTLPNGDDNGYCYFGVFADQFMQYWKTHQRDRPFNPKTINGIVLARSTGTPSHEIQEFMRYRFSFGEDCCILEVSRT